MEIDFPENVKKIRKKRGFTQESFSAALGLSRTAVGQYESGRNFPSIHIVVKMAEILGITLDELILKDAQSPQEIRATATTENEAIVEFLKNPSSKDIIGQFADAEVITKLEDQSKVILRLEREINTLRSYNARLEKDLERCEASQSHSTQQTG